MTRRPDQPPLYASEDEVGGAERTLFITDAEMIRRLGVPEKIARVAIRELDRKPEFPKKDLLMGGRRFWPAVVHFFCARHGIAERSGAGTSAGTWEEDFGNGRKYKVEAGQARRV